MKKFYEGFKSLLLPIVALAAVAGIFQDLLLPLAKFGVKAGVLIIVIGTLTIFIGENSRIGMHIKEITNNWKYPIVVSMYVLGISIMGLSILTEQSGEDRGILASNFSAFETVQSSLLGIEKSISETKKLVEENIEVTQAVKNDTSEIKKDTQKIVNVSSETLNNTNEIIANTKKNAYEELVIRGLQPNDPVGFVMSVKEGTWEEFTELMEIYKNANFDILKKVKMPDAVMQHGYNSNPEMASTFFLPSDANLINILLIVKADLKRLDYITELYELDISELTSPIAAEYARNQYVQFPVERTMRLITHPQIQLATGEDIDFSLISHQLKRNGKLTNQRGEYNLIHFAAKMNYQDYITPLIERGLNVNATSLAGYTPLALALESGHLDMADFLLQKGANFQTANNIAVEIALIKALAHNNAHPSDGTKQRYYSVAENPYFQLLKKYGVNQFPKEIQASVVEIYKAYLDYEQKTYSYGSPSDGEIAYKSYIDWLKQQQTI